MENLPKAGRRTFMRRGAMGAGAMWMLSLQELSARAGHRGPVVVNGVSPYGPVSPKKDQTNQASNCRSCPTAFVTGGSSWTGDAMSDGVDVPNLHDGMAVVDEWHSRDDRDDDDDDERERRQGQGLER